jgi:hypothetical protein
MKESSQISLFIGLSYNGWSSLLGFKVLDFEIFSFICVFLLIFYFQHFSVT